MNLNLVALDGLAGAFVGDGEDLGLESFGEGERGEDQERGEDGEGRCETHD